MRKSPIIFSALCLTLIVIYFCDCNNSPTAKKEVKADSTSLVDTSFLADTSMAYASVKIPFFRGAYQVNGASPWYGTITVGSMNQLMKVGLDCGNNANWLTSTQCNTPACTQPGRYRFNFSASKSFQWVNRNIDTLEFGPWGNMTVNTGQDVFNGAYTPNFGTVKTLLSVNYNGPSFAELDWDGGIGFPSQSPDSRTTWLLLQLLNKGLIDPNRVCVSFYTDDSTKKGMVIIGGYDLSKTDPYSALRCPFKSYNSYNGALNYLWSTKFSGWYINGKPVSDNDDSVYVFDTGASDFKGDTVATDAAITAIRNYYKATGTYPAMQLLMGIDIYNRPGTLLLTDKEYLQKVEAGPLQGQKVIAIDTLEVSDMVLAGSTVLEDLYTIFWWKASGSPGNYQLTPIETYLFNKKNGPVIIQNGLKKK